jgi:hypothetical protein
MAFTVPFVILALIAIGLTVRLFRNFSEASQGKITIKRKKENRNERYSVSE